MVVLTDRVVRDRIPGLMTRTSLTLKSLKTTEPEKKRPIIMGLLDMMLWIADDNSRAVKEREAAHAVQRRSTVTAALLEDIEWEGFKHRLHKQKQFLTSRKHGEVDEYSNDEDEVEEDDLDILISLSAVLDEAKIPLTLSEIVRQLQHNGVLSSEFTATARAQTRRLLDKMRALNKIWQDTQGRWSRL